MTVSSGTSVVFTRIQLKRDSNWEIEERESASKSKEGISSGEMKLIPYAQRYDLPLREDSDEG